MDAPAPGGLGGTFGGNPLSCAAALAVLDAIVEPGFRERSEELGARIRARLEAIAAANGVVGEVRGLGPMLALELVEPDGSPATAVAAATVQAAYDRGLVLLSCGLHGNVIRILVPLVATDDELGRGLDLLEESLGVGAGTG
jgi:4-aminobutyrate aminotransferase/(S)-3-amino-2-methylpropionate transaminase